MITEFLEELESRNIKQIEGDKGRVHKIKDIGYTYVAHAISASFKDFNKLSDKITQIIPECDTIVWRTEPSIDYFYENGEEAHPKLTASNEGINVRFYLRALFLKDGKQVLGLFPKKEGKACIRI